MPDWEDGDIIRASCRLQSATGEDIVNVFHWKCFLTSPETDTYGISQTLYALDEMYDEIQPSIPSDVQFVDIDIANLTKGTVYAARDWPSLTAGGGTGDTMPEQVCGLVVGRTNVSHAIGRKFLGPFIEAANSDGTWYSTLLTMLQAFAGLYDNGIALTTGTMYPGVPRIVGTIITAFNVFLSTYTSNQIYTQRRRRRGVGS